MLFEVYFANMRAAIDLAFSRKRKQLNIFFSDTGFLLPQERSGVLSHTQRSFESNRRRRFLYSGPAYGPYSSVFGRFERFLGFGQVEEGDVVLANFDDCSLEPTRESLKKICGNGGSLICVMNLECFPLLPPLAEFVDSDFDIVAVAKLGETFIRSYVNRFGVTIKE